MYEALLWNFQNILQACKMIESIQSSGNLHQWYVWHLWQGPYIRSEEFLRDFKNMFHGCNKKTYNMIIFWWSVILEKLHPEIMFILSKKSVYFCFVIFSLSFSSFIVSNMIIIMVGANVCIPKTQIWQENDWTFAFHWVH